MPTSTRPFPTRFKLFAGEHLGGLEKQMDAWAATEEDGMYIHVKRTQLAASTSMLTAIEGGEGPPRTAITPRVFILVSYKLMPITKTP